MGPTGAVTFRLHEALHNGESVYFIRTDASDQASAEETGLLFVNDPLVKWVDGESSADGDLVESGERE